MATGDPADMAFRMASVLPARWFPSLDAAPVLSGLLSGLGQAWSFAFDLLAYAERQTRIATASGAFLDMISADFNGTALRRKPDEADPAFRARIVGNLLRERATRSAVETAVSSLTGSAVTVFEPMRPADTGAYASLSSPAGGGGSGYGVATLRYGSLSAPYQIFIDATRPTTGTLTLGVTGYASTSSVSDGGAIGGYNVGAIEYAPATVLGDLVTDATVEAAVAAALPVSCTAWVRFA